MYPTHCDCPTHQQVNRKTIYYRNHNPKSGYQSDYYASPATWSFSTRPEGQASTLHGRTE